MSLITTELQLLNNANNNLEWLQKHYKQLKVDFPDKFIAIKNGKVIASSTTMEKMLQKLEQIHENTDNVLIKFIYKMTIIL